MDLGATIEPKSDQLNSDDLIAGPRTIKITKVAGGDTKEQPVSIYFEGDNGKPYKACKSMRRVLVQIWGRDGASYIGRSLTLYRDPDVKFGGIAVGGIRISHMSHLEKEITLVLTASKASRKPFSVKPLKAESNGNENPPANTARDASIQKLGTILKGLSAAGDSIKWDAPGMLIDYVQQLFDSETIKSRDDLTDEQLNVLVEDLDIRLGELQASKGDDAVPAAA